MDIPPSQTIYIKNLPEKLHKDALRQALYAAFCQFGPVMDVVAMKGHKLRGQAWVAFKDVTAATNALRDMQGFSFYEKPMEIVFSVNKSDAIAKVEGTFVPREKRKREIKKGATGTRKVTRSNEDGNDMDMEVEEEEDEQKSSKKPSRLPPREHLPPNHILLAKNLPEECSQEVLTQLFKQYHGLKEVRMVPGKKGLAFIEFDTIIQASNAVQGLYGFKLTSTALLDVNFAK